MALYLFHWDHLPVELSLVQVVNAFCGLFRCGHCHKAVAASSRTPSICHNLGTHHLKGKHGNMSCTWNPPTQSLGFTLFSSDMPQVRLPPMVWGSMGKPCHRCLKRGRWLGKIMLLSCSQLLQGPSPLTAIPPGNQDGSVAKAKWRQTFL